VTQFLGKQKFRFSNPLVIERINAQDTFLAPRTPSDRTFGFSDSIAEGVLYTALIYSRYVPGPIANSLARPDVCDEVLESHRKEFAVSAEKMNSSLGP
jgi:hypothetical protein